MSTPVEDVESLAMLLPREERARLAGWPGQSCRLAGLRQQQDASSCTSCVSDGPMPGWLMVKRRVYDGEKHVHFVTFSCYRRRQFLQQDQAKRIVIGQLGSRLAKHDGLCTGFVIMPDHVHALVWFPEPGQLSGFMNKWKDQSSHEIKKLYRTRFATYWSRFDDADPIWQPRYYDFNIWSRRKIEEKLDYIHLNPVRAGLAERAIDYRWSSAAWYLVGKSVGLPINWPPGLETDDDFVR